MAILEGREDTPVSTRSDSATATSIAIGVVALASRLFFLHDVTGSIVVQATPLQSSVASTPRRRRIAGDVDLDDFRELAVVGRGEP
jgi:hypothetical protein